MGEQDKCPVDHNDPAVVAKFLGKPSPDAPPTNAASECPVDHNNPEVMAKFLPKDHLNGGEGLPPLPNIPTTLRSEREVSSIPKYGTDGAKWVYPSEQQFYSAMKRKKFNPDARDMPAIIPIHNAVNERCWMEIMRWEGRFGGPENRVCGGPQLVKFEGDSSKLTPRARFNTLLGSTRPFDRHDWTIDRCGNQIDYVIDFYSGQPDPRFPERQSFYLDVRPKLNSWEGIKMRLLNWL